MTWVSGGVGMGSWSVLIPSDVLPSEIGFDFCGCEVGFDSRSDDPCYGNLILESGKSFGGRVLWPSLSIPKDFEWFSEIEEFAAEFCGIGIARLPRVEVIASDQFETTGGLNRLS